MNVGVYLFHLKKTDSFCKATEHTHSTGQICLQEDFREFPLKQRIVCSWAKFSSRVMPKLQNHILHQRKSTDTFPFCSLASKKGSVRCVFYASAEI